MRIYALVLLLVITAGCSRHSVEWKVAHRYALSGRIVSLDAKRQTVSVNAAAIPNYMEAMTMDYPVRSKSDFDSMRTGEQITATLEVTDDDRYALSNIKPQMPGK